MGLLEQLQRAVQSIADHAGARDSAVAAAVFISHEQWKDWHEAWQGRLQQLVCGREGIQTSLSRAALLAAEAEREWQQAETALRELLNAEGRTTTAE